MVMFALPVAYAVWMVSLICLCSSETLPIAINCGSSDPSTMYGIEWEADRAFLGDSTSAAATSDVITNPAAADDYQVFQTERFSVNGGTFSYQFTSLPQGLYMVSLLFAEIYFNDPDIRIFSVAIESGDPSDPSESIQVITDLDLGLIGHDVAYTFTTSQPVLVDTDGILTLKFIPKKENPKINGIYIYPSDPNVTATPSLMPTKAPSLAPTLPTETPPIPEFEPIRLNCGGAVLTDSLARTWVNDETFLINSAPAYSTADTIFNNVSDVDQFIYQSERWMPGTSDLQYQFINLPNMDYIVVLHFAEIWFNSNGSRVVGVEIQGADLDTGIDCVQLAGHDAAVQRIYNDISVVDGTLRITIVKEVENPRISGIEILGGATGTTLSPTLFPTEATNDPSAEPTFEPSGMTLSPTRDIAPTSMPSLLPSFLPTQVPSLPTTMPSAVPTDVTLEPSASPTLLPTRDIAPTSMPSKPSSAPSLQPTQVPSLPTMMPSIAPSDVTLEPSKAPTRSPTPDEPVIPAIRLNCGGGADFFYVDGLERTWISDEDYVSGGGEFMVTRDITNKLNDVDDIIYQSERVSGTNIVYTFEPMFNTLYDVTLHFSEIWFQASEKRIFEIQIQNTQSVSGIDIYDLVGRDTAWAVTFKSVAVTDGKLDVTIVKDIENAKIAGLEIVQSSSAPPSESNTVLINCGTLGLIFVESGGNLWDPDDRNNLFIADGTEIISTSDAIITPPELSDAPNREPVYQTARVATSADGQIVYSIPQEAGVYEVTLHFAEIVHTFAGARVLNIAIEDQVVESDLDIFVESGGHDTAFSISFGLVGVLDGLLDIVVTATTGVPLLCGIEIDLEWNHFAHPVIQLDDREALYLAFEDLRDEGFVQVLLDGTTSHTHTPFGTLLNFVWTWESTDGQGVFEVREGPDLQVLTPVLNVGVYDLTLSVVDDFNFEDSITVTLEVLPGSGYNGCIAYYYDLAGQLGQLQIMPDLTKYVPDVTITESSINFDLDTGTFGSTGLTGDFAAQFRCYLEISAQEAGPYAFAMQSNDGAILYIDEVEIVRNDAVGLDNILFETQQVLVMLEEGRREIIVEYFDSSLSQGHGLKLLMDDVVVPANDLFYALYLQLTIITSIFPTSGPHEGGTTVTLEGENMVWDPQGDDMTVVVVDEFGGMTTVPASDIFWNTFDTTKLTLVMPASPTLNPLFDVKAYIYIITPAGSSNGVEFVYDAQAFDAPAFGSIKTLATPSFGFTSLEFGPDGKLYALNQGGDILRLELEFNVQTQEYSIVDSLQSVALKDYVVSTHGFGPTTLGIAFNPNDPAMGEDGKGPIAYISYSRFLHGEKYDDKVGFVAKVSGENLEYVEDVISQLPVAGETIHAINAIFFDKDGLMYVSVGGSTNAGIQEVLENNELANDEGYFSAAVLGVNLYDDNFDGNLEYDAFGYPVDFNNGIFVFAAGLRNPYDALYHPYYDSFYCTDNGPNAGFGDSSTSCDTSGESPSCPDKLNKLFYGGYFGHPNRVRGRMSDNSRECVFHYCTEPNDPEAEFTAPLETFPSSTNGLEVYYTNNFGGGWRHSLLLGKFVGKMHRVTLSSDGESVVSSEILLPADDAAVNGLDIRVDRRGCIFFAVNAGSELTYVVPIDDVAQYTVLYVVSVFPRMGPISGNRNIIISGYNFVSNVEEMSVSFGAVDGPACVVQSVTLADGVVTEMDELICQTSDYSNFGSVGAVDIYVSSAGPDASDFVLSKGYTLVQVPDEVKTPRLGKTHWIKKTDFNYEVGELSACAVDETGYYVFGGHTDTPGVNNAEIWKYEILTDTWIKAADVPDFGQGDHQTCQAYNGKIYTFGGSGYYANYMKSYDTVTNTWELLAELLVDGNKWDVWSPSSGLIGDKMYVTGGVRQFVTQSKTFEYDLVNNVWTEKAPMPGGGRNHAAGIGYNGLFYMFGGRIGEYGPSDGFDDAFVYDPGTNVWSVLSSMLDVQFGSGQAVHVGGKLIVVGGEVPGFTVAEVQAYDVENDEWEYLSDMVVARHGIAPVAIDNVVYVACGGDGAGFSTSLYHEAMVFL